MKWKSCYNFYPGPGPVHDIYFTFAKILNFFPCDQNKKNYGMANIVDTNLLVLLVPSFTNAEVFIGHFKNIKAGMFVSRRHVWIIGVRQKFPGKVRLNQRMVVDNLQDIINKQQQLNATANLYYQVSLFTVSLYNFYV